jgi:hypothetical protein
VFTDFPSTALHEAIHLRKPVLALVFPQFTELRSSAARDFAPILRQCEDEMQALTHLTRFLDDPPEQWTLEPTVLLPRLSDETSRAAPC